MPKPLKFRTRVNLNPYAALASPDSTVAGTLDRLTRCVPMPLDSACLLLVCQAVQLCLQSAFKAISDPNTAASQMLADFSALALACEEHYKESGVTETLEFLRRRLTTFPAWYSLAFLGSHQISPSNSTLMAAGMELAIKLTDAGRQPVAPVFMRSLTTNQIQYSLSIEDFVRQVNFDVLDQEVLPGWFSRGKTNYSKFVSLFSATPPPPPPPPTFEERAAAQLSANAAFAKFHLRAAVLDTTMLSLSQVKKTFAARAEDCAEAQQLRHALLWFAGFSGLTWDLLPDMPLMTAELTSWAVCLDVDNGLLLRDFRVIADDSSNLHTGNDYAPSSYISFIPLPALVRELLISRRAAFSLASKLSDLLPELHNNGSRSSIYQTAGNFQPSFARLGRTMGPLMRMQGIDNLLSSIVSGNFGNSAKSKLYYCSVSHSEIWTACTLICHYLDLGVPVEMPANLMHFGTGIVPPVSRIEEIDTLLFSRVQSLRPSGKATASALVAFHNAYVTAVTFRFIFLLGLREAKQLVIWADVDELKDLTIDIGDKKTNGLDGGLPVVMSTHLKTLIQYFRPHCLAMRNRLKKIGGYESICDWLEDVCNSEHAPLLCLLTPHRRHKVIGTIDVIHEFSDLAPDYGRKFLENWGRTHAAMTRDIDRQMRHEVMGQESYTSIAAHSEFNWAKRLLPLLDDLATEIFVTPLTGLRTKL